MTAKQKKLLLRIVVAAVLYVPLFLISEGIAPVTLPGWALFVLFMVPYLTVGYDILRKAVRGVLNRQMFDECFLMTVATVAAIALGELGEGVAVMLLYQVGELFQSIAVGRSRKSIAELMDMRPDYANLEADDGTTERVDPDDVEPGSIIVIRPGEKVPIDGVVIEGACALNTAALTGESAPREVGVGDRVLSGTIDLSGVLRLRTTAAFDESTASKILDLVENAAARKSKSENFISKFARVYTPTVCALALALAVIPTVVSALCGMNAIAALRDWVLRACTFLVISCPCAVVISVPLSFFAGLGGASSRGILIKGSNYLETLSRVDTVVLDKTGTITHGNFEVTGVHDNAIDREALIEYAALAECRSTHPISQSLQRACGKAPDPARVKDIREIAGHGVTAVVDGHNVAAGNARLIRTLGIAPPPCDRAATVVHVAVDGKYAGYIAIEDTLKPGAREAVERLRRNGVKRIVMLTGDAEAVANKVAREVGSIEYRAGLLPQDKVACVEELLKGCGPTHRLAFVGDGVNDAPVLARADIGIAMGALGSDAAIEAADVVLMDDDPAKIADAIRHARRCLRIVRQNIGFALGVKLACLLLAALGVAGMWIAILADVGVMVAAVLNAMRCLIAESSK